MQNPAWRIFLYIARAVPAAVLFVLLVQMSQFGWIYRTIDLTEQSAPAEELIPASTRDAMRNWVDRFGYRLNVRKIIFEHEYRYRSAEFVTSDAIQKILKILAISPLEPAYWLTLARLKQLEFAPIQDIVSPLRLSYVSGRSVYPVMAARFQLALSIWPNLERTDRIAAVNDLIYGPTRHEGDGLTFVSSIDEASLSELIALVGSRDSELSTQLLKIAESRTQ